MTADTTTTPEQFMAEFEEHLQRRRGEVSAAVDRVEALSALWTRLIELSNRRGEAVTINDLIADATERGGELARAEVTALCDRATKEIEED